MERVYGCKAMCTLNTLHSDKCPKTKLKLRLSQKCWQIKSQSPSDHSAGAIFSQINPTIPQKSPSPADDTHKEAK